MLGGTHSEIPFFPPPLKHVARIDVLAVSRSFPPSFVVSVPCVTREESYQRNTLRLKQLKEGALCKGLSSVSARLLTYSHV